MPDFQTPHDLPSDFTHAAAPGQDVEPYSVEADAASRRSAAELELLNRHADEYEDVHNGSGRSEEFPSDLDARHQAEWEQFERDYPEQLAPQSTPAAPKLRL